MPRLVGATALEIHGLHRLEVPSLAVVRPAELNAHRLGHRGRLEEMIPDRDGFPRREPGAIHPGLEEMRDRRPGIRRALVVIGLAAEITEHHAVSAGAVLPQRSRLFPDGAHE